MAAPPSTTGGAVASSYPPPPPWYLDFSAPESINKDPPPLPVGTYTSFGWPNRPLQLEKQGVAGLPQLDSDTLLYNPACGDLRPEFSRLFSDLSSAILDLIDKLSKTGHPGAGSSSSTARSIIKIYKNLQHILVVLRLYEAQDAILTHLDSQLRTRRELLSDICQTFQSGTIEGLATSDQKSGDSKMEKLS